VLKETLCYKNNEGSTNIVLIKIQIWALLLRRPERIYVQNKYMRERKEQSR